MLRHPIVTLLTFILLCSHPTIVSAQCLTPPPLEVCTGTETILTDNEFLTSGAKKWYYGGTTTYNALTMRGGTLVVCGDLTIDKFTMDSGTIVIRPGARFVVGTGIGYGLIFKGNAAVYNYGRFECRRNLTLDWPFPGVTQPNIVMNVTSSAVFDAQFVYFGISSPNSFFVNKGKAQFHGVTTDPAAGINSICLGGGSEMKMNVLYNRARLPYNVFGGQACVQVTTYSQFYDTLTRNPNVYVCLGASHTSDASCGPWGCRPNAWGTPSLFSNCNLCPELIVLPIAISNFTITRNHHANVLRWKTNIPASGHVQWIERSLDGVRFTTIDSIKTSDISSFREFEKIDRQEADGAMYYRIRIVEIQSGKTSFSSIKKIAKEEDLEVFITPNPISDFFRVSFASSRKLKAVSIYDMKGVMLFSEQYPAAGQSKREIRLSQRMRPGVYMVKLIFEKEVLVKSLIVQ